jgi:hypothetical protein
MLAPSNNKIIVQARIAAILIGAVLLGIVINNYVNLELPQKSFIDQPCVECPWNSDSEVLLRRKLKDGMVITAQEAGDPCCAMLGYTDQGETLYCYSPILKRTNGAYKGLQQLHCDNLQLFTFYKQMEFHCDNLPEQAIEIKNATLAAAYTVAFALMSGFNCS